MNDYHIQEEIGAGKYSEVYKVTFTQGRKKETFEYVAIKKVQKCRRKKILNEVPIFHNLEHENILRFFNWYESRNYLWVIFELCTGGDLLKLLEQDKKLPEITVRAFGKDILAGLLHLHIHGILYIDLRPSNILMNEYGVLKLSDFGQSKKIVDLEANESKRGTPYYMAPELFQDGSVYSYYSDLWSFGCVMYEMLSGHPPFTSSSFQNLVNQILNQEPANIPNISSELQDLLNNLLRKDPATRITWQELVTHPFWQEQGGINIDLPQNPQYEKYLQSRGVTQRGQCQQNVDVLRISQNVQRNLLREMRKGGYQEHQNFSSNDVKLEGVNQVLDFGEKQEDEEASPVQDEQVELSIYDEDLIPSRKFEIPTKSEVAVIELEESVIEKQQRTKSALIDEDFEKKTQHSRSNSAHTTGPPTPASKTFRPVPLDQLLLHTSDTAVKPIIGNREIEKTGEITFNARMLGFSHWTPEELLSQINSQRLEVHLNEVYTSIAKSSSSAEKLNVLCYFETLIMNSAVANRLINSPFTSLFVKLLRAVRHPALKARTCSIIGYMVRHATVIDPEIVKSGLINTLVEQLSERSDQVRQRAIAALGEFLFYAATQMDEEQYDHAWDIPTSVLSVVCRKIKKGEDGLVRFYATKTVENITAQSKSAGRIFARGSGAIDLCTLLAGIVNEGAELETFQCSAAVSLGHLVRLNNTLVQPIFETLTIKSLVSCLSDGQARMQQALLTLILFSISGNSRLVSSLYEESTFLPAMIALLENSGIVIRGKALLVFRALFKFNPRWLMLSAEHKFYIILDRLARDNFKYVQCCLHHLIETLIEISNILLRSISDDLSRPERRPSLSYAPILLHLSSCNVTKSRLQYQQLIKYLSQFITNSVGRDEFRQILLMILESVAANTRILTSFADPVINSLLPVLLEQYSNEDANTRFQYLKIFIDIVIPYLFDESVYDITQSSKPTTKLLNDLIAKKFLPLLPGSLADKDPIPLFSLKLVSSLLERCPPFTGVLKRYGVISGIFQNFSAGNPRLNAHLIKVVKRVIESKDLTVEEIRNLGIIDKANNVMVSVVRQEWCIDLLLDIIYELLFQTAEQVRSGKSSNNSILDQDSSYEQALICTQPLLENFPLCGQLINSTDSVSFTQNIADKAGHCLALMLQLYGYHISRTGNQRAMLSVTVLDAFLQILNSNKLGLQKRVLKVLNWALQAPDVYFRVNLESLPGFMQTIEKLRVHQDVGLSQAIQQVLRRELLQLLQK